VEEVGFVKDVEGMMAVVSIPKKSACEGCSLGVCKPDEQSMEIRALNPFNAHVGQKVKIVMKPYTYLKGSMIVYGIPAVSLIIGAVLGKEILSLYFNKPDPDIISALSGLVLFVLSFIAIKLWSSSTEKKIDIKPVIKEILDETD
jgi:sigma-E factor negative regulatory protein RseC